MQKIYIILRTNPLTIFPPYRYNILTKIKENGGTIMKGTTKKRLLRLLRLTTVLILLIAMLAACGAKDDDTKDDDKETEGIENTKPDDEEETKDDPTDPPATTTPEETTVMATVNTDLLNVRTSPSTDAPIAGQLNRDAQVEILEQTTVDGADWARTEVGWVQVKYLKIEGEEPPAPDDTPEPTEDTKPDDDKTVSDSKTDSSETGTKGTITASSLYIRKGAGTKYDTVGKYSKGDVVTILETKNNWGRTDKGWISLKYVKLDGQTSSSSDNKDDSKKDNTSRTLVTDGKTKVLGTVEIDVGALNVRYGPGTKYDTCGKVYDGEKYDYYQEKYGWVRIKEGWISLAYTDQGNSDDKDDKDDAKIEVTDGKTKVLGYAVIKSGLNVRTGPGTKYDDIDTVSTGERVAYYQKDGNWVRTKDGWISLKYAYVEGDKTDNAFSGTVTGDKVNIRKGPGTGFDSVAKVNKGDKVSILETIKVGSTTWGYTGSGWISLDYVKKA